jgi:hypothetical protein
MLLMNIEPDPKIDFSTIDWNLSNVELMSEYGWTGMFCASARHLFGRPKWGTAKTRNIDWSKADWANMNNCQIARELHCPIPLVSRARIQLGAPTSPGQKSTSHGNRVIDLDKINKIDWSHTTDVQVSRAWGGYS